LIKRKQINRPCLYSLLHTELKNPAAVFIGIRNRRATYVFLFNEQGMREKYSV